jgi:hypothetical protein
VLFSNAVGIPKTSAVYEDAHGVNPTISACKQAAIQEEVEERGAGAGGGEGVGSDTGTHADVPRHESLLAAYRLGKLQIPKSTMAFALDAHAHLYRKMLVSGRYIAVVTRSVYMSAKTKTKKTLLSKPQLLFIGLSPRLSTLVWCPVSTARQNNNNNNIHPSPHSRADSTTSPYSTETSDSNGSSALGLAPGLRRGTMRPGVSLAHCRGVLSGAQSPVYAEVKYPVTLRFTANKEVVDCFGSMLSTVEAASTGKQLVDPQHSSQTPNSAAASPAETRARSRCDAGEVSSGPPKVENELST